MALHHFFYVTVILFAFCLGLSSPSSGAELEGELAMAYPESIQGSAVEQIVLGDRSFLRN